ncbi:MAG: type II secretion system F family protein [Candidatus Vogelbacteria bacterium]|nr:type II secretion system F family protein [Candidatus Vogelbacteria bacterium]
MEKRNTKIKNPFANFGLSRDRDYLVENLSTLVSSGMPIVKALDAIAKEIRSTRMKKMIENIKEDIDGGSSIWRALEKSNLFKDYTISLIRLGEESGRLIENLKVVAIEEQKERLFRSKLRSAMVYPLFVLTLTTIVGIGIAWFILPKLATVFSQLKIELPLVTKILIGLGAFLGQYGQFVIPIFVATMVILFYFVFFFSKTKIIGQVILFVTPGIKDLMKEVEIARFGYLLGTLLEAGLPVTQALDSLSDATDFVKYRRLYRYLLEQVEDGNSFQKGFLSFKNSNRLIPMPIQQLIVVGEQSGNLANSLLKIGESFEGKSDATTKNLTVILEPVLLVIVWVGVMAVALAVILPIYSLVGGLQSS